MGALLGKTLGAGKGFTAWLPTCPADCPMPCTEGVAVASVPAWGFAVLAVLARAFAAVPAAVFAVVFEAAFDAVFEVFFGAFLALLVVAMRASAGT